MQTILGAGGAIGIELAKALPQYTDRIRLVSRHPEAVNPNDELFPADLTVPEQVDQAVMGSKVVYLTVGLPYDIKVWRRVWPTLMRNVLDACTRHGSKLVFFDNIYMYDREHLQHMTEETPMRPTSKKGLIREEIAKMLLKETAAGKLDALIARSADFIAPTNSILVEMVYKNLLAGKKADWMADASKVHTFTYAPDAAQATALLGNSPEAYGQVWHLPTDPARLTGAQWVDLIASEMGVEPRYRILPVWLMGVIGVFVPIIRELKEMAYQYDRDYFFDSGKFDRQFKLPATPAKEAVRQTVAHLQQEAATAE